MLFLKSVGLSIASVVLRITQHTALALLAVTHTFQWLLEDVACICAADALVFMLVLVSLLSFEALSLCYIAAAAVGMFDSRMRTRTLPRLLASWLATIAIMQYCRYIVYPDAEKKLILKDPPVSEPPDTPFVPPHVELLHWFGVAPTLTQLTVLLATAAVAASAKHTMFWHEAARPHASPPDPASTHEPFSPVQQHALYHKIHAASLSGDRLRVPLAPAAPMPVRCTSPARFLVCCHRSLLSASACASQQRTVRALTSDVFLSVVFLIAFFTHECLSPTVHSVYIVRVVILLLCYFGL